jgi:uncharacterized membrane protein
MKSNDTKRIVATALFIALVGAVTMFWFPTPGATGGYMHLGTLVLLIIALRFGKHYGLIAGAVGMTLADLLTGAAIWAPGTFVVVGMIGYVAGWISESKEGQGTNIVRNILAWGAALLIKVIGYYLYEAIFMTGFEVATISVIGNLVQFAFALIAIPVVQYSYRLDAFNAFAKGL